MLQKHRQRTNIDANESLPQDLTPQLRVLLEQLPPSRKVAYLKESVFSKFVSDETAPAKTRRQRAINKLLATEKNNEATNDRLMTVSGEYNILPRVSYERFMGFIRHQTSEILGQVPPDSVLDGSFSGGATTSRVRTMSHPAQKYLGIADATPGLLSYVDPFADSPLWQEYRLLDESQVRVVPGNVLFTVPKNAEIDRCACKEPDLNMYIQKGAGNYIRRRLKKHGVDLNDQSVNQRLACDGSITGALATLDLSSASDSICTVFVEQALPDLWFTFLNAIRSPVTMIDGEVHKNEMFSNMGNGFTFELESLLFYVVARAVAYFRGVPGVVSIYGDDIICPVDIVDDLIFALSFLGFSINTEKSFWDGDFRESCGGHYIGGRDVTPFYVKAPVVTLIDLIHLCNSIRRWAEPDSVCGLLPPDVDFLWVHFASMVPFRFWGGHDTADKTRLVTLTSPDRPSRLSAKRKKVATGLGGYLHWHDSRGTEISADIVSFAERAVEAPAYRIKPVRGSRFSVPAVAFFTEVSDQGIFSR